MCDKPVVNPIPITLKQNHMSTSLYWRIIPEPPKEHSIDYLKHILGKRLFGEDWNGGGEAPVVVDQSLIQFLEGIVAAGGPSNDPYGKDAQRLIDAINRYGKVEVYIQ